MYTTIESTALDDQHRERRLGIELWQKTKILLDERDALKVELQRLKPNPALARESRSDQIEALVLTAVANMRAEFMATPRHKRVSKILSQLKERRSRLYRFDSLPDRRTVLKILRANGLY